MRDEKNEKKKSNNNAINKFENKDMTSYLYLFHDTHSDRLFGSPSTGGSVVGGGVGGGGSKKDPLNEFPPDAAANQNNKRRKRHRGCEVR